MSPSRFLEVAAFLALLCFPALTSAQKELGLTLRFFQQSQDDACSYAASSDAPTFTALLDGDTLPTLHCLELADLFNGSNPSGSEGGITWTTSNSAAFGPSANYSSALYRQYSPNSDDAYSPGHFAGLTATLYPSPKCSTIVPNEDMGVNYYGFNCLTEEDGSCGTMPFAATSLKVGATPDHDVDGDGKDDRKCLVFAQQGAAAGLYGPYQVLASVVAGVSVAVWLAL